MALSLEKFQQNFKGHSVPEPLKELLLFQNTVNDWYSGSFELNIVPDTLLVSFIGENSPFLKQFIPFGHDSNGSVYALWLHKGMFLENAPTIYLNAEGEGSTVIANTLQEFFLILAYDEEPVFGEYSEVQEQIVHTPANQEFRIWLRTLYNLNSIVLPKEIVNRARLQQPDLQEWLNAHQPL